VAQTWCNFFTLSSAVGDSVLGLKGQRQVDQNLGMRYNYGLSQTLQSRALWSGNW